MTDPVVDPRAVTPVYGWRVPVLADVPNVPANMTNLAADIEATVKATTVYRGSALLAAGTGKYHVTLPAPFPTAGYIVIATYANTGPSSVGSQPAITVDVNAQTAAGFDVYGAQSLYFNWIAVGARA